ncbi:Protein CBG22631, partial [Caenorhabditis briggsae]
FLILVSFGEALVVIVNTHQFIVSLLAIQRFFLYFFPSSETFLNLKVSTMSSCLKSLYWLFFLSHFSLFIAVVTFVVLRLDEVKLFSDVYPVYYIALHIILFFCAALYIPIVVSIRKLQHLASPMKNKPHKYILYQS